MTEAQTPENLPAKIEPTKRSCLGCAFKGGLGCFAFFGGVVLILVLFGPNWVAGWLAVSVRDEFNRTHAGSVEGIDFEMSWGEPQYLSDLRLLDPDGEEVLAFDLELPGLWELVKGLGGSGDVSLGRIQCEVRGEIVADESGLTNLERALESTRKRPALRDADISINGRTPEESLSDLMQRLDFVLDVKSPKLVFSSPQTKESGVPVELRNLEARLRARPGGGAWTLSADADIVSETEGRLDVSLTAWDPDWKNLEWPLGVIAGEIDLRGLSSTLIDGLLGQDGRLVEAFGPTINLDLDANDVTANKGTLSFGLDSDRQELSLTGHFEEGAFRMKDGEQLVWTLDVPRALIEPLLADSLPEGLRLDLPEGRWVLELENLVVPIVGNHVEGSEQGDGRLLGMLQGASFESQIQLGDFAFEREGVARMQAEGLVLRVEQEAGGLTARAEFELRSGTSSETSSIEFEVRPRDVWKTVLTDRENLFWDGDLLLADLPLADVLRGLGIEHAELALLEGQFAGKLSARNGNGASARLSARLQRDSLRLSVSDLWTDESHLVRSGESELLVLEASSSDLESLLAEFSTEDLKFTLPDGTQRIVIERCELPRLAEGGYGVDLVQLEAKLRLETDAISVTPKGSTEVVFNNMIATLVVAAGELPQFDLRAGIAGHGACDLQLKGTTLTSLSELTEAGETEPLQFAFEVNATSVPTSLLDDLAEQNGLLVDVLGPSLNVECGSAALSSESGRLTAHLSSELGTLDWAGELRDSTLVSTGDDQLAAKVGLSPLLSERVIGSLVPLLVQATKEPGAESVLISVSDCSLPLGGDLSQVNGKLRLDLGAVQYRVLPQFEEFLGESTRLKSSTIAPIDINIVNGLATYENLAIEIGDKSYEFRGSIELATQALNFETEIPLGNLGDRVDRNLRRLVEKGLISSDVAVPVTLTGSTKSPRVGFRDGFLESLTKDLLPGALDGVLKGAFDKLFDKD